MPVIPTPTITPAGGGADAFGTLNSLMDFQNKVNQNRRFQAEFMANQAMGEIVAHSPSLAEGLNTVQKNPIIMGFGGEGLRSLQAYQTLQLQGAETRQKLRGSGFEMAAQAGAQAMQDPLNYSKYYDNALNMVDPIVRNDVAPQIQAIKEGIGAKIKGFNLNDPAQLQKAKDAITAQVAGAYTLANGDPSHLAPLMPGMELGPGGEIIRRPSQVEMLQGGGPRLMPGAAPAGRPEAGSTVVTNTSSGEQYPMDAAKSVAPFVSRDQSGNQVYGLYGNVSINPEFKARDELLHKDHVENEKPRYDADRNLMSGLTQMQAAADDLTAKGGFTVPGFMGGARGQLSNALETIENMTGKHFTGDAKLPAANADISTINKWHQAVSFQLKQMFEGTGARGLGVLMEASAAVPGMENTPLQFKVLTAGLRALANWDAGKYEFKEAYQANPATGGSLLGSDIAYSNATSPMKAAERELGAIGIHLEGDQLKMSDDEMKAAYSRGLFGKPGSAEAEKNSRAMYKAMHPEED
jgi:hypothetical protein